MCGLVLCYVGLDVADSPEVEEIVEFCVCVRFVCARRSRFQCLAAGQSFELSGQMTARLECVVAVLRQCYPRAAREHGIVKFDFGRNCICRHVEDHAHSDAVTGIDLIPD